MAVLLDGQEVGMVTPQGAMRVRAQYLDDQEGRELYHRAGAIAAEVYEYMTQMDAAPLLKAQSLSEPYKQLADFNGCVLGGLESSRGVQFATWQWTYNKTGLTLGHYCGDDYAAAKADFAIRSGLVDKGRQFSDEQLTEIYRCTLDTLERDYILSEKEEKLLESVQEQIRYAIPDLSERIENTVNEEQGSSPQMGM